MKPMKILKPVRGTFLPSDDKVVYVTGESAGSRHQTVVATADGLGSWGARRAVLISSLLNDWQDKLPDDQCVCSNCLTTIDTRVSLDAMRKLGWKFGTGSTVCDKCQHENDLIWAERVQ